jgi:hypothetical protein
MEADYSKLLENSKLGKPYMQNGVDLYLLTLDEWKPLSKLNQVLEQRIVRRVEELSLYFQKI